jgi:hypothetical protein
VNAPAKRTAKKGTTRKTAAARGAKVPGDHQPKAVEQQSVELTEADYQVDMKVVLQMLGVDPATVKAGTTRITFPDGIPVIEYEVFRAVPARVLGMAMLRGNQPPTKTGEAGEPPG